MPSPSRPVRGRITTPSASFVRPADTTAYASGDLVANSTTAASVVALSWVIPANSADGGVEGMIRKVRMFTDNTTTTNASFRIHFYTASPVVTAPTNGDNGAYAVAQVGSNALYLGSVDVAFDKTINNGKACGQGVANTGAELNFSDVTTLYGLVEARLGYTPASGETLTVVPEVHVY